MADADAAAPGDAPAVGFEGARQHVEEGGFAVAVASDDADAIAFFDAEGDVVENGAGRVIEVQRLADDQRDSHVRLCYAVTSPYPG